MSNSPKTTSFNLQRYRSMEAILALIALVLAYFFGLKALDTGSWLQYAITFALLIFGVRHVILVITAAVKRHGKN